MTYKHFFITGLPRSGTTFLSSMFKAIGINCYGEGRIYGSSNRDAIALYDVVYAAVKQWAGFIALRKGNVLHTDGAICTVGVVNSVSEGVLAERTEAVTGCMIHAAAQYLSHGKIAGIKTPILYPKQIERMIQGNPESLIIILTRDPADWIVSLGRWYYRRRKIRATSWDCIPFNHADFIQLHRYFTPRIPDHADFEAAIPPARFLPVDTIKALCAIWSVMVRDSLRFTREYENVRYLQYEALWTNTEKVIGNLCGDFGLSGADLIQKAVAAGMENPTGVGPVPGQNTELLLDEEIELIGSMTHAVENKRRRQV